MFLLILIFKLLKMAGRNISKRQKFAATSILVGLGLFLIHFLPLSLRYPAIVGVTIASYFLSAWSLREGMSKIGWLTILSLPTIFTAAIGFFYFLIPGSILVRIGVSMAFSIIFYFLLLTENIFAVAAVRTIQLLRSAHAASFLLSLVAAFFIFNTIFSFRLSFWWNFILIFVCAFPICLQFFWSINLQDKIDRDLLAESLIVALVLAEISVALSFWPMSGANVALGLVAILYACLGLYQHLFSDRLFKKTVIEYLLVGFIIFLVVLLSAE